MERTNQALDHVINYYVMSRELADLVGAGPNTSSPESLNIYLEALDKLAEAQNYFNKNNPQSVELENINTLYNSGVAKLESAFEDLLNRHTRPLSPATLLDMIALEEDSSVESGSVSGSGSTVSAGVECMRAAAAWLSGAGRAPVAALLAARAPNAKSSLQGFRDYLRTRSMGHSPLMRAKNNLNRSDSSAKKTSRIHKALEKRANKMLLKASQTLEQSTGLALGPRRGLNESYTEETAGGGDVSCDEMEAEQPGELAACLCRVARAEQRALLGLVPLPRLPALLQAVLADCEALLAADVEVLAIVDTEETAGGGDVSCDEMEAEQPGELAACLCRVARAEQRALLGLVPLPRLPALLQAVLADCEALLAADVEVLANVDTEETAGGGDVSCDEMEAEQPGELAACLCRVARAEQRALLGLVPLPRLPALLQAVLADCEALLAADVEVLAIVDTEETAGGGDVSCDEMEAEQPGELAACLCRVARAEQRALLGLVPLPRLPALLQAVLADCEALLAADVEVLANVDTEETAGGGDVSCDEMEAEQPGELAACLCRVARAEQRALLGLVPLPRLPALLQAVLADCEALLAADVERVCGRYRRAAARCSASAAGAWALLARLQRLRPDLERALAPAPPAPYTNIVAACQTNCLRSLEEWVDGVRNDAGAPPVDGTVHQLAAAALALLQNLAEHVQTLGPALATEPSYARALAQLPHANDRNAALLAIYMRKVLAQLNLALRTKSEQYPDALRAIFRLNNTHYLLQGLQRSCLLGVLLLAEPDCEASYRDMIQEARTAYLQSWSRLLAHTELEEVPPAGRLRDRDRQIIKDKFASFNRELEESTRAQRSYSVPDAELRESLKRDNKELLLPAYGRLHAACAHLAFSKNQEKYVKYNPVQVAAQLDGYFDVAA